jgi:hypothetical protein
MQNQSLCEKRQFSGCLKAEGFIDVPVIFRAHLTPSGQIEFDFDRIVITKETAFLRNYSFPGETGFNYFSLTGQSDDGIELEIDRICFANKYSIDAENEHVQFRLSHHSKATFTRKPSETQHNPLIRMCLIGFKRARFFEKDCPLGTISMGEYSSADDSGDGDITGFLQIEAKNELSDISVWCNEAHKLLQHVRHVMSFALGLMLRAPIVEFYEEDKLVVDVLPQIRQASTASFPVFQSNDRKSISEVAVNSFFDSPFKVENLFIAIEWFVMNSSYPEVRLVNAMTVLENLISSNLDENEKLIISDKKRFDKQRQFLRRVIKRCFDNWFKGEGNQEKTLSDINENLANLNRRSLRQKLDILAKRWSIPLEDIGEKRIKEVISARNLIIHQGHYNIEDSNLLGHAMVARELVIRFIFGAIGFQGRYISHLKRKYHLADFPPKNDT